MSLIYYLNQVLGIKSVPRNIIFGAESWPESSAIKPQTQIKFFRGPAAQGGEVDHLSMVSQKLIFIHAMEAHHSIFEPEAWALFQKMTKAMGLKNDDFETLEFEAGQRHQFFEQLLSLNQRTVVYLSHGPERLGLQKLTGLQKQSDLQKLETYSPVLLIRSPHLKKPAWDDLQAVMKVIKP
jgi:hypothetical protein